MIQAKLGAVTSRAPDPRMRVGHAEKDAVLEILGKAYGDGKLELDEYEQRQDACLAARFADELAPLTSDLSASPAVLPKTHESRGAPLKVFIMSGKDMLLEPERPTVRGFAFWGGSNIHVGDAIGPGVRLELSLTSIMGGYDVFVPPGVRVVDESQSFLGGVEIKRDARGDGANGTLIIRGFNLMGGTSVKLDSNRKELGATD